MGKPISRDKTKHYNPREFHKSIRKAFHSCLLGFIESAKRKKPEFAVRVIPQEALPNYFEKCSGLISDKEATEVVLISGSLHDDLKDTIVSIIAKRLSKETAFSVKIFVGKLSNGMDNVCLRFLKESVMNFVGKINIVELRIKPSIHGVFTNNNSICQYLHTEKDHYRKNYLFDGVNILDEVNDYISGYR